jgi:hypothetical protein
MGFSRLSIDVLSLICDFLSTPQEILVCLSHLNHSIADQLKPICFRSKDLCIPDLATLRTLLEVNASSTHSLARIGAVKSLTVMCDPSNSTAEERKVCDEALVKMFQLRSPSAPFPSFLFSSLTSVSITCRANSPLRLTRHSLFQLLSSKSASFTSLTSLHLDFNDSGAKGLTKTAVSLEGLRGLRQIRIEGSFCHFIAVPSVLRTLWSLPHLLSLDVSAMRCSGEDQEDAVLKAFCKTPPPPSSSLLHLLLPSLSYSSVAISEVDQLAEALTRSGRSSGPSNKASLTSSSSSSTESPSTDAPLSSTLPAGGLEMLTCALPFSVRGLRSLLTLPSLRTLDLSRARIETSHICSALEALSAFQGPRPTLVALLFPIMELDGDLQLLMDRFAVLLPPFLSRQTELRHLSVRLMVSQHPQLQSSIEPLQHLQSLEIIGGFFSPVLELKSPLWLPQLLEVKLQSIEVLDEELGVLLSASPQLLHLRLCYCELQSWSAVQIAAAHCPQLMVLEVSGFVSADPRPRRRGHIPPVPVRPRPRSSSSTAFLPHLISISLHQVPEDEDQGASFRFSDLLPLIYSNNRCLQSVEVVGSALTAVDICSLKVLPSLRRLCLSYEETRVILPEVKEAVRTLRRYRPTAAQRRDDELRNRQRRRPHRLGGCNERISALAEWDREAVVRRLNESVECELSTNLLSVSGLDVSCARVVFFEALQKEVDQSSFSRPRFGRLLVANEEDAWRPDSEDEAMENDAMDFD